VASCAPAHVADIMALAGDGVEVMQIGVVGGDDVVVDAGGSVARVPLRDLARVWEGSIPEALEAT
jgi:hypothetical protein